LFCKPKVGGSIPSSGTTPSLASVFFGHSLEQFLSSGAQSFEPKNQRNSVI
jgi:hypothetical protein